MKKLFSLVALIAISGILFSSFDTNGLDVGDKATDFRLLNVDGNMVSLADMKDAKGYIVTFTCNHCPFSVMYEDRIIALNKKYASMGYPVVAINPNDANRRPGDSFAEMKIRAKEKGFDFPYLYDETQEVAKSYGATRTPHVYLLDASRKVRYIGAIDNNASEASEVSEYYLADAIEAIEAGKNPDPDFTKAAGCTIKWKPTPE